MIAINHPSALLHEFERDVREAFRQKRSWDSKQKENTDFLNAFIDALRITPSYLYKISSLYFKSYFLVKKTKRAIKRDYRRFLQADTAGKDAVFSKWENIMLEIQSNVQPVLDLHTTRLLKPTMNNIREYISICNNFGKKLHTEYKDDLNLTQSQEYLKGLASKFSHLPQDILDDLASDKYSERF